MATPNNPSDYLTKRSVWLRCAIAITVVAVACATRLVFLQSLGARVAYVTLYPAVIIASLYGGLPAGLLATVLSALAADYFWMEPVGSFYIQNPADKVSMVIFLTSCMTIVLVTECHLVLRDVQQTIVRNRHPMSIAPDVV